MTQEEKGLLFKDLCARVPYEVRIYIKDGSKDTSFVLRISDLNRIFEDNRIDEMYDYDGWKPYLRPMSSMTEEEYREFLDIYPTCSSLGRWCITFGSPQNLDWLNAHHFDYRGLIEKDLALEAPKGMYK